jgi:ATP-dependent Zn protease
MKPHAATAFHEAGHAVAAFFLDIPIPTVTIVPDKDYLGLTLTQEQLREANRHPAPHAR